MTVAANPSATERMPARAPGSGPALQAWRFAEGEAITPELTTVRLLGGGSSYEAYLAFDELCYCPVVVKVVRPDQVEDGTTLRGLRREVEALATVNHPAVVRALRSETEGDRPHVVLEQVDGPRLSTLIRRYGPLQPQQYLPLAIEVAGALHYFGHIGWCHLDIKPSNIIMGAPAKLIDLSVARPVEEAARLRYEIGTDAYLPPEQADPGGPFGVPGPAGDVFGLAATLFHAVSGYRPFPDGDPDAADRRDRYPQLTVDPDGVPDSTPLEVVDVLAAGLEKYPENRPRPDEFAEALAPVLERQPTRHFAGFKVH